VARISAQRSKIEFGGSRGRKWVLNMAVAFLFMHNFFSVKKP